MGGGENACRGFQGGGDQTGGYNFGRWQGLHKRVLRKEGKKKRKLFLGDINGTKSSTRKLIIPGVRGRAI